MPRGGARGAPPTNGSQGFFNELFHYDDTDNGTSTAGGTDLDLDALDAVELGRVWPALSLFILSLDRLISRP